jgi:hypothetical protein
MIEKTFLVFGLISRVDFARVGCGCRDCSRFGCSWFSHFFLFIVIQFLYFSKSLFEKQSVNLNSYYPQTKMSNYKFSIQMGFLNQTSADSRTCISTVITWLFVQNKPNITCHRCSIGILNLNISIFLAYFFLMIFEEHNKFDLDSTVNVETRFFLLSFCI